MAIQSATFADNHLSEEDIKSRYIQPALEAKGWDKYHMRLELDTEGLSRCVQMKK